MGLVHPAYLQLQNHVDKAAANQTENLYVQSGDGNRTNGALLGMSSVFKFLRAVIKSKMGVQVRLDNYATEHDWRNILERNAPETLPTPKVGFFTNFFGVKTDIALYSNRPGYESLSEQIFSKLPIPGDGHHVGAAEYGSFFLAMENRASKDRFTMVEIGAGWGPWISAAGVIGKRLGIKNLDLVGVEADSRKVEYMRQHLRTNNLLDDNIIHVDLICGAAWTSNSDIYFGADKNFTDYAAAAVEKPSSADYLGRSIDFIKMQGITLEKIIGSRSGVDYMTLDIQGSEFDVLSSAIGLLNSKVRFLSVGTHSPAIHGKIIELCFNSGWHVAWDKYPIYKYDLSKTDLTGMIISDGELVLVNNNLISGGA